MTDYIVHTKDIRYEISGKNPQIVMRDFFRRLKAGLIKKEEVGMLGMVIEKDYQDEEHTYPFRVLNGLYNLGIIDFDTLAVNTEGVVGSVFTKNQLLELAEADKWMIENTPKSSENT